MFRLLIVGRCYGKDHLQSRYHQAQYFERDFFLELHYQLVSRFLFDFFSCCNIANHVVSSIVVEVIRPISSLFIFFLQKDFISIKSINRIKRIKSIKRMKNIKRIKGIKRIKSIKKMKSIKSQTGAFFPFSHYYVHKMLTFSFLFACLTFLCSLCFLLFLHVKVKIVWYLTFLCFLFFLHVKVKIT